MTFILKDIMSHIHHMHAIQGENINAGYKYSNISNIIEEIVYNSIDANSTKIIIRFNPSNLMFEVEDNGVGILSSDLMYIGKKNWTTKEGSTDLYGYKGESLYFISFIAEIEIYTCHEYDMKPQMVILKNGSSVILSPMIKSYREKGTTVTLKSIFSDMPVRKLKLDPSKVISNILATLERISIINSTVSFEVYDSFSRILYLKTDGGANTSMIDVFIRNRKSIVQKESFRRINIQEDQYRMEGFIGRININELKTINSNIMIYINNIYINKNTRFRKVINEISIKDYFSKEFLPVVVINILYPSRINCINDIEPHILKKLLDTFKNCILSMINLPNKESKFANLKKNKHSVIQKENQPNQSTIISTFKTNNEDFSVKYLFRQWIGSKPNDDIHIKDFTKTINSYLTKDSIRDMKVLSQMDRKFILVMYFGILYAFDQHAVDERIRYELLKKKIMKNLELNIHRYSVYFEIEINSTQKAILTERKYNIERYGWRYNIIFENNKIILQITQSPSILDKKIEPNSLLQYVSEIERDNYPIFPSCLLNIIKSKACRSAIKFGDLLSKNECYDLIKRLSECENPFECAHGRPSIMPILNTHE